MKGMFQTGLLIASAVLQFSCNQKAMSVFVEDKSKGLNGSFEYFAGGAPVNWQVYTAKTVKKGDFDIEADTREHKDGAQSLKFTVRSCEATGGWYSPGIAVQLPAKPGELYKVTFWTKNEGTAFKAVVSGVSAFEAQGEMVVNTGDTMKDWKLYEHTYTIPPKMNALRFELNLVASGVFWLDDVRIEKL